MPATDEKAYEAIAQNDNEAEAAEEPARVDLDWRKDDGLVTETRCDINGQQTWCNGSLNCSTPQARMAILASYFDTYTDFFVFVCQQWCLL
jgi:N-methylhydantoinase B/oxoprolinase/acetone carboxylase alpha subunit